MLRRTLRRVSVALIAAAALAAGPVAGASAAPPGQGPGGPILVVDQLRRPLRQLLRGDPPAEGLNEFAVTDVAPLTAADARGLRRRRARPHGACSRRRRSRALDRLGAGRRQPDRDAAGHAARRAARARAGRRRTSPNGYMQVDTGTSPGAGSPAQTMQFHGTADRWTLDGRDAVARALLGRRHGDRDPAVTLRDVGTAAARRRRSPTTSRARSSTRARATRPGRATKRDGDAERDPPGRPLLRRQGGRRAARLGRPRARSRSRRPTSSSACSPT